MNRVCVFPGQGAQKRGMGKSLFARFPERLAEANAILGYCLRELCLENPEGKLANTRYAQPALFVVCALGFLDRYDNPNDNQKHAIRFLAGHSLGEYVALFAAGVFDFATGIALVKRRGELMSNVKGGGMAAVLGLSSEMIEDIIADSGFSEIDIANQNSPQQTVIAGTKEDLKSIIPFLKSAGAKVILLDVSGAFHSRQMRFVANRFADFLKGFEFDSPQIPVIANVTAKPYLSNKISETLARQIASPVLWTASIRYLLDQGETMFEEIGPAKVLTKLITQIRSNPSS